MSCSSSSAHPAHANAEVHERIMEDLERMSADESLATLVDAGICTEDGQLTEAYVDEPDEPRNGHSRSARRRSRAVHSKGTAETRLFGRDL